MSAHRIIWFAAVVLVIVGLGLLYQAGLLGNVAVP